MPPAVVPSPSLRRRLGVGDAVVVGLGAMLGAGVFVVWGAAAQAAGAGLLPGLVLAATVAGANATSSARLAGRHPQSGGTYVYGRERLGPFWGGLAGWAFVVGKIASCAAMALTVGAYLWPDHARPVAVAAVLLVAAVDRFGVERSAAVVRALVVVVLVVLAAVVAVALSSEAADLGRIDDGPPLAVDGTLQAAGLLFFAFAGYARITTLGEEVRDPARTIGRAVPIALGLVLAVYAAVAVAALAVLGPDGLAGRPAPLAAVVEAAGAEGLAPVVRTAAAVAALGALAALVLGVSRTILAMGRDARLPRVLAAVDARRGVPHRATLLVGAVVALLAGTLDLRGAIGFSSFAVLAYYAIANASAWTLGGGGTRTVAVAGLAGCLLLAVALPSTSIVAGAGVLVAAAAVLLVQDRVLAGRS